MLHKRFLAGALALAAAFLLCTTATATAAPTPTQDLKSTWLLLSVNPGERPLPSAKRVTLTCQPTGGSHPLSELACAELAKVNGDITSLEVDRQRPCYLIYAPLYVTAYGYWKGQPVQYQEKFPNDCVLDAIKGAVFKF
ncbi:SSI family serine proteinase inhibitor [Amycolatopsis anabasis]|uniref:SSI family serine proteinase inhibitor n=1 Tax=Amycolatopsis anabasis TaxID=1840409 RepID=UPI00131D291C|nr:SSI family serine proteinase inhibitor [Amycolatopsis anabasis]